MFEKFYPNEYLDSTYLIDFEGFYERGFRGIIFDIDNTLVPHDLPADERAIMLFKRLKETGYKVIMLSNNKEMRVKKFCDTVDAPYIFKAGKPNPKNYKKACDLMGTDEKSTLFVGDQIFTDVWGANKAGLYSILVKPIHPKEEIQIVIKRYPEKLILFLYQKRRKNQCSK